MAGKKPILCFGDVRCFVTLFCLTIFLYSLVTDYSSSVLTTIERRYNLNSAQLSSLVSISQAGVLLTIMPVSYLGGRPSSSRPRWVGCGLITVAFGTFIRALPHFILGQYAYSVSNEVTNGTKETNVCPQNFTLDVACNNDESQASKDSQVTYVLLATGVFITGAGYSALYSLGSSFVDDHSKHESSSLYLGIMSTMWGVGDIAANFLGAACLLLYVDFNTVDVSSVEINSSDKQWIGAWWLGKLCSASAGVLVASCFFFIPKRLSTYEPDRSDACGDEEENGKPSSQRDSMNVGNRLLFKVKEILKLFWRFFINPYYMVLMVGYGLELGSVGGLNPFIPKYMEVQFGLTPSTANVYTGLFNNIANGLAALSGGIILKKYKLGPVAIAKFMMICLALGTVTPAMLYPFHCIDFDISGVGKDSISKNQPCNLNCSCSVDLFDPVCGSDGNSYASPCHVGCTQLLSNNTYTDCNCIPGKVATIGMCNEGNSCSYFYPFLVTLALYTFVNGLTETPCVVLTMRSGPPEEKAFALGLRIVINRCLGFIPLPLIYGVVIDMSCSLWRTFCEGADVGECLVYDSKSFRLNLIVLTFFMKLGAFICYLITYILWKRRGDSNEAENDKGAKASHVNPTSGPIGLPSLNDAYNESYTQDTPM
ncbi:solute carrier organic anion transporter family member 3A1-like [Glandiceps talaboti]